MPRVAFTSHLARHVDCPTEQVEGATVRDALERYLARYPKTRSYILDEQGELRPHVVVFVAGEQLQDRTLRAPVADGAEIYVMQALSGG